MTSKLFVRITDRLTSTRNRTLTKWSVYDWKNGQYSITGYVLKGNAPGDGENIRITRTSPIQSYVNNTVTTTSGSIYELLEPRDSDQWDLIKQIFGDDNESN